MTETHAPPEAHTRILDPTGRAASEARAFVAEICAIWGIKDDYPMRLVASELVTNSYRHGKGVIVVRLYLGAQDGLPVVEVWDQGEGRPAMRPENHAATGGRGLFTVAALSTAWGVRLAV
jgi:anti-sigma regulatory factor (Ser/Thr protein kinase)